MENSASYYCTSCMSVQKIHEFHFCPKKNAPISVVEEDKKHLEVRFIGEDINLGDLMSQEIDMHGSGLDPATGKSKPWFKACVAEITIENKNTLIAWRNFKKGEEVNPMENNEIADLCTKLAKNKLDILEEFKIPGASAGEIPIADVDPRYHALNTILTKLPEIAELISIGDVFSAHHEILTLEKYIRGVQTSASES